MADFKEDIIAQLKREILSLRALRKSQATRISTLLGHIENAFPNNTFPVGAVHEFISSTTEQAAATYGFVSGLLSTLMNLEGACIWVSSHKNIFPPALKLFGIDPSKIIFVEAKRERDALWVIEEALKCEGLAAVIGEIKEISFTESRRLQLAVEQSRVTGLVIRHASRSLQTNACVAR